jgi:hypothetical protein
MIKSRIALGCYDGVFRKMDFDNGDVDGFNGAEPCPACGAPTEQRQCKLVCSRQDCGALVASCSEF